MFKFDSFFLFRIIKEGIALGGHKLGTGFQSI